MKRLIFIAVMMLGSVMVSRAQDIITTRSGEDIQAKVEEVSPLMIKYKRFSNLDGPTYSISTAQVVMIRYENGEKDVFDGVPVHTAYSEGPVPEGLRYKELKHIYNPKMYIRQYDDRFSPGWLGFASFVIPGLGQAIEGEWWRAAGFFFGSGLLSSIASNGVEVHYTTGSNGGIYVTDYDISTVSVICVLANLGLEIWNIVDAVRIAKVKNMYVQDLRAQRGLAGFDVKLEPFVASAPSPAHAGFTPAAGLSFKVTLPNK
ncbi:MAG: hypothetical protein J6Y61_01375 [Bacteroidales bacterium]|nr:hypothetical protein [Bacteroidales bacterium]